MSAQRIIALTTTTLPPPPRATAAPCCIASSPFEPARIHLRILLMCMRLIASPARSHPDPSPLSLIVPQRDIPHCITKNEKALFEKENEKFCFVLVK
jgi:hypothetical protein